MAAKSSVTKDIELHPDGWQRFERAMAVVVKAPPQHRVGKGKPKPKRQRTKKAAPRS
jgi:hypothetical protein